MGLSATPSRSRRRSHRRSLNMRGVDVCHFSGNGDVRGKNTRSSRASIIDLIIWRRKATNSIAQR